MKAAATKHFVLDASLALAWCCADEAAPHTDAVLDSLVHGAEAHVPTLWPFELANALLVAERRKRITLAQVTAMLQSIALLPIAIESVPAQQVFGATLSLARQQDLSEYAAAYLDLALHLRLPLATLDGALRRAAGSVGIKLVLG